MSDTSRRRLRRRHLVWAAGAAVVVLVAFAGFALRTPAPIGHWDSAAGHDRFMQTYTAAFADLPRPQQTLDVRTDYGVVRVYRFAGTGEAEAPLVLLPGRASATPVWADNLPLLLEIGDVYTIDLLGEPGMSVQERPIIDDETQAAWLHQTLQHLPEPEFHLVGLSIGGWTAINLARHQPALIASVTTIDPVFVFDSMPLGTIVRSIPAAVPWLPKSWRDSFTSYTAGGAAIDDEPVAEMIEAGMRHYRLKLPQPSRISEDELTGLGVPVLAIIAGDSVMHDPRRAAETAERALPDGAVLVYPGASHAISGEQPEQIASDIAAFIAENP